MKKICLIGNPNCGKSSLFNQLTNGFQKVGNWNGVTTESKSAILKNDKKYKIVDLPGAYSLKAISDDERAVLDYINNNKPDGYVVVVDANRLILGLKLAYDIINLNIPTIIAVNFYDEVIKNKTTINFKLIEQLFGTKVVPVSAKRNINLNVLIENIKNLQRPNQDLSIVNQYKNIDECLNNLREKLIISRISKSQVITKKIDNILLNRFFGISIFVLFILLIYTLSYRLGGVISNHIERYFDNFCAKTSLALNNAGVKPWLNSLVVDSIFKGVGTIICFLPQILILFVFMTIFEESGYASRVSFLLDGLFKHFGLSGKSLIPMVLSCGCAVTGLTATRTLDNVGEKRMTILLSPFMPCSAKTVVFAWFSKTFFNSNSLIATSLYFISIFSVAISGFLLSKIKRLNLFSRDFFIEIPTLRLPTIKNIFKVLFEKIKDFLYRVGTIIFLVSIIIWLASNFGFKGYCENIEGSFIYNIGNGLKWVFKPLGFGNWQACVSLICGAFAKESVIEVLEIVAKSDIQLLFANDFSVYAFMCFVLLSPPCLSAIITTKKEIKIRRWLYFIIAYQFIFAYAISFGVCLIGYAILSPINLIIYLIVGIITIVTLLICAKRRGIKRV